MKEVCVLIAVFNGSRWLRQAIESAIAQQGVDHEVLIVDDGSTDSTPAIVEQCQQQHPGLIRYYYQQNRGLSAARNAGFDRAGSEFVTVLDADDSMHPARAKLEIEALRRFPDAVFSISCRWNFMDGAHEGWLSLKPESLACTSQPGLYEIQDPLTTLMRAGEPPGTSACSTRLSFSRSQGRYDEEQRTFVDGELWLRVAYNRTLAYCSVPLYYRRMHDQSMSGSIPKGHEDVFRALERAGSHWSDYNEELQACLTRFERRAAIRSAKQLILQGRNSDARKLLWKYRRKCDPQSWRRMLLAAMVPHRLLKITGRDQPNLSAHRLISREEIEQLEPLQLLGLK